MTQIPNRQNLRFVHCRNHGIDRGKIVLAFFIDKCPGNSFARHGDSEVAQNPVIFPHASIVLRFGNEISAPPVFPKKSGTFETGNKKGWKNAWFFSHVLILSKSFLM